MILSLDYWQSWCLNIKGYLEWEEKCVHNIPETSRRVSTECPAETNGS